MGILAGLLPLALTVIPYNHVSDEKGKKTELFFTKQDVSLVTTTARWVILRLATPWLRCLVVGAHAPHSGQSLSELEDWWQSLADALPQAYQHWPRLLLTDANAKVGADSCSQISTVGAEMEERKEPFIQFVRSQGLWLPATFECHSGHSGPSGTWRDHTGQWLRNDFIGLPVQWQVRSCRSWTATDIDAALHHEDHCAALVHFSFDASHTASRKYFQVHKNWTRSADLSAFQWVPPVGPDVDVHTHALMLQRQIAACLPSSRRAGPIKLKLTMSDETWELVLQKRQWRTSLHDAQDLRSTWLHALFSVWRMAVARAPDLPVVHQFDQILCQQDRLIATALFECRRFGGLVTQASRADDFVRELNIFNRISLETFGK